MDAETDRALLLELAERLTSFPTPEHRSRTQLFPGEIPGDLKNEIVVPATGRLIGSVVRREDEEVVAVETIVDVPDPIETALSAYEHQLFERGWEMHSTRFGGGGFVTMGYPWRAYSRGQGPSLMVNVQTGWDEATEIRLRLDFRIPADLPLEHRPPHFDLMPTLYPPPGVRTHGGGSGGGGGAWSTHATAWTDMAVDALESYFADQLVRQDWKRLTSASTADAAVSLWDTPKERWRGLLVVMSSGADNERSLVLHMQGPANQFGGGYAATSTMAHRGPPRR